MKKYPVIIIGAGIGGLTTAAYLSQQGIPFLLLEQTAAIGGRCSTRMINGLKYEIGAIYVGGGVFDHLRQTFGVKCHTIPVRCGVKIGEHIVSIPIGLKTLWELRTCGVSWWEILLFMYRSRILSDTSTFERYESIGQVFDKIVANKTMRRFFDVTVGVSGISPYCLPSQSLSKKSPIVKYKAMNPEYFPGGNGKISTTLFDLAAKNGEIVFNEKVNKILVKNGCAVAVKTNRGEYSGDVIVSNAGLRNTVLKLTDSGNWPVDYYEEVKEIKTTLQVANIFLTFSRSFKIPKEFAVFLVSYDVNKEFQTLEKGSFSSQSMFILHVPSNIEPYLKGDCRATLQFYYPRGQVTAACLDVQVQKVMYDGLEKLFKGFSKAITSYTVYDPIRYEQEFGFSPYVFGVSPELNCKRFPNQSPITNLYCVGDSVMPEGPCVPQAMDSGLDCAQLIATKLKIINM